MAKVHVGSAVISALLSVAMPVFSQTEPPATAAYPDPGPASGAAAAATPTTPSTTTTGPAAAAPAGAPPPAATSAAAPGSTNASRPNSAPPEDGYNVGHSGIVEPPAPPQKEDKGFEFPDMSVRVDPLNWIIYGRLGIELEATVWKFITLEVVPEFVTSTQPPAMNLGSFPATLSQHSNGLGAMSGASFGAGFWLNGKPFVGTVLRLYYTNYGYRYTSTPDAGAGGIGDEATHTDRHLVAFIGSHSKWGPFTIAGGIGLGVELNRERRCFPQGILGEPTKEGCTKDTFDFRIPGIADPANLYGWLHPAYLSMRLSLGFVF